VTGPFGLPWPTFSALIVILLSVAIAVVWSLATGRDDGPGGGGDE
jgi:hypothetical protein